MFVPMWMPLTYGRFYRPFTLKGSNTKFVDFFHWGIRNKKFERSRMFGSGLPKVILGKGQKQQHIPCILGLNSKWSADLSVHSILIDQLIQELTKIMYFFLRSSFVDQSLTQPWEKYLKTIFSQGHGYLIRWFLSQDFASISIVCRAGNLKKVI